MIVDTSGLVAIVLGEPGHERLVRELGSATRAAVGAPTLVEAALVLEARLGSSGGTLLGRLLDDTDVATLPFDAEHARVAASAFRRYGRVPL